MIPVDLNCDLGEGFGNDAAIMPWITSANICCGAHAGSEAETLATLERARAAGVVVGAHPGYPDRANFGRREWNTNPRDLLEECSRQLEDFLRLAKQVGVPVRYIKPHGAMYHQVSRVDNLAEAIVGLAKLHELSLIGLPGSRLDVRAREMVPFFAEGFADRRYRDDGSLVPRGEPDAIIHDVGEAVAQVRRLVDKGVRTVCVHGDQPQAVAFLFALRLGLAAVGVSIRPFL
jgi:5-oxoprolinase (ATP-hydrolysing) subunit A